jgi:hypothetical protein
VLFLPVLIGAPFPAAALPTTIIAAPPDPLGDIAARRRADEPRCPLGGDDAIVVCGRVVRGGDGYRVPYQPEPGARVHLIAGEVPSGMAAMGADSCLRFCYQPVMINLLDPRSIARGIDRILGGD